MSKILIVEDDQLLANIYRNKFSLEGFETEVALDGEAGLGLARSFRPDAIVLDLVMPKVSGVEVLRHLRAEPDFKTLPVIVFSNTYLSSMMQDAFKAGATKCLSKTVCTPAELIRVVRSCLASHGGPPASSGLKPKPQPEETEEARLHAKLRDTLIRTLPGAIAAMRPLLKSLIQTEDDAVRVNLLDDLFHRAHTLTGKAAVGGMLQLAQMADALEALLKELHDKPKNINPSTLRTVASAIDLLTALSARAQPAEKPGFLPGNVLIVDDDAVSRRAMTVSLEKANLRSVSVSDPQVALNLLAENRFDLVLLDVNMPSITGFDLCEKMRALPQHKGTPIVFVTGLNDFGTRANSTRLGGADLIGKPFLVAELALKALFHILRVRLEMSRPEKPPQPATVPA